MKTLEAINQILLMNGERQVREISSPPSLKARVCLVDAIREFSLLGNWPALTTWAYPVSWSGNIAKLPDNTIKILAARTRTPEGKYKQWRLHEEWNEVYTDFTYTIIGHNQVEVSAPDTFLEFRVTFYPELPTEDILDIAIDPLYLSAILKRAQAMFALVHLEDAGIGSQHTAEYELLLTQLRSRARQNHNGVSNVYRNGRV
jgi:hypothetical protein